MKKGLCVAFVASSAMACAPLSTGSQAQAEREFDMPTGRGVRVQGTPVWVTFRSVSEDSRCATDVQCVWAGNAKVSVSLSQGSGPATDVTLNTGLEPRSTVYAGHTVRLIGLKPAPRSGQSIAQSDYVATFEVVAGTVP